MFLAVVFAAGVTISPDTVCLAPLLLAFAEAEMTLSARIGLLYCVLVVSTACVGISEHKRMHYIRLSWPKF